MIELSLEKFVFLCCVPFLALVFFVTSLVLFVIAFLLSCIGVLELQIQKIRQIPIQYTVVETDDSDSSSDEFEFLRLPFS
jgi:hypothetical protein